MRFRTRGQAIQVKLFQGAQQVNKLAHVATGLRGNIFDDQLVNELRLGEGKRHRHFSTHRMPQQIHRRVRFDLFRYRLCHVRVAERVGPRRFTVVRQVNQDHSEVFAELFCNPSKVLPTPHETMQKHQSWALVPHARDVQCVHVSPPCFRGLTTLLVECHRDHHSCL